MRVLKRFKGNSGCSVELCEDFGRRFVRKTSQGSDLRIARQHDKLQLLPKEGPLRAPQIFRSSWQNTRCLYEMEYVPGISFAEYLQIASIPDVIEKFRLLLDWIEKNSDAPHIDLELIELRSAVHMKLCDLAAWQTFPLVSDLKLYRTRYHGDLTFENIIVMDDGTLVLIDALDSYVPCYFADLTKLSKELFCFWSRINSGTPVNVGVYSALRDELLNSRAFQQYGPCMKTLVAVDMLRTLPYLDDDAKIASVREAIECLI